MATEPVLTIGYAGSLSSFDPDKKSATGNFLKDLFWTYRVDNVDFSTRSGYYLFRGLQAGLKNGLLKQGDIQVNLWGIIDAGNAKQAEAFGLGEMVKIEGYVPKAASLEKLLKCDVLFLPLECGKNGTTTLFIPGKVFEYLTMHKPVLCLTNGGDCADILSNSGLGILLSPFDPNAIAEKLAELVRLKKENQFNFTANEQFNSQFDFKKLTVKLADVFDQVLLKP